MIARRASVIAEARRELLCRVLPTSALNPVLLVFSLLSIATVGLGVLAGILATRGLNRVLAPLLILPLVFLTQGPGRVQWGGSISALSQCSSALPSTKRQVSNHVV